MVRTQIYLTEHQRHRIAEIAEQRRTRQSQVIREAVDRFIEQWSRPDRERIVRETAGMWSHRSDIPDFETIRGAWERG